VEVDLVERSVGGCGGEEVAGGYGGERGMASGGVRR